MNHRIFGRFIIFVLFICGLNSQSIAQKDTLVSIEGKDSVIIISHNGIKTEILRFRGGLKNGWQESFHSNGNLKNKSIYSNGFPDGEYFSYDFNGNLLEFRTYKYDKSRGHEVLNGKFEKYSNGQLMQQCSYKDSLLDGVFMQYNQGYLTLEATYKSGLLKGKQTKYYPRSGKILAEEFYTITYINGEAVSVQHGNAKYYSSTGKLRESGSFELGKKSGEWIKYFNESTNIEQKQFYKNGVEFGDFFYYFPDGQVQRSGIIYRDIEVNGTKVGYALDGKIREFYANGQLKREEVYDMGSRSGLYVSYYESGQMQERGSYKQNLKNGQWEYWDKDGNMVRLLNYSVIIQNEVLVSVQDGIDKSFNKGALSSEIYWKKGKKDGVQKSYYQNGALASIIEFSEGNIIGKFNEYYQNGKLKSEKNYNHVLRYDGTLSADTKEVGWSISYDETGRVQSKRWYDAYGNDLVGISFHEKTILQYRCNNAMMISFAPEGQVMSLIFNDIRNQPCLELYFYRNGNLRKIAFQNADTKAVSYADITSDGQVINLYSNGYHNPDSLRPNIEIAMAYAQSIDSKLSDNPLFTDLIKNGSYILRYANGKPLAILNFKDDLPDGNWVIYDAVTGEALLTKTYNAGVLNGPYELKFAGILPFYRGSAFSNYRNQSLESYHPDGRCIEKVVNDEKGNTIYKAEYYDNGKLKRIDDKTKGIEIVYFKDGSISLENMKLADSSYQKSYFESNGKLRLVNRYKVGKYHGVSEQYYESGQLQYRLPYIEGKRHGEYVFYNEDGSLKVQGFYRDDKPEGQWIVTNDGHLDTIYYRNGEVEIQLPDYACACIDTVERKSKSTFMPSIQSLVEFEQLQTFVPPFFTIGAEMNYQSIFYRQFYPSGGSRSFNHANLEIVMFNPFAVNFPADKQFLLTFNPCRTFGYISSMPVSVSYSATELTYLSFSTKAVKLDFLKGPLRSADPNHTHFSAYIAVSEILYREGNMLEFNKLKPENNCFTKGIIKNFLTVQPITGHYFDRNSMFYNDHILKPNERTYFYGVVSDSAILSFYLYTSQKQILITGYSDLIFLGGKFVAGTMTIPCSTDDAGNLQFPTSDGYANFDIESVRSAWRQNGFSRLELTYDNKNYALKINFFAE